MNTPDLRPFLARGFGEIHDRNLVRVPVRGIDRLISFATIRLAPETKDYLYGKFTEREVMYRQGSRPVLEDIVKRLPGDEDCSAAEWLLRILKWTVSEIKHPNLVAGEDYESLPTGRNLSEEAIIASGWGWCNEQARVVVALCQVAGSPARMCSLWHRDPQRGGHMACEVYVDGKWRFVDASMGLIVRLPEGGASAWEISTDPEVRRAAARAYRDAALATCTQHGAPRTTPGLREWIEEDDQHELFHQIGITNYYIY
jgi:hypothetical protein